MARRKVDKRNIRKLQKNNGSYYLRLPIEYIREFDWRETQKLVVKKSANGKLAIEDWKE